MLRPDGRPEDADLLVARDTAAQSAQVSRVYNSPLHEVSRRGHRFTVTYGVSPHYHTLSAAGYCIFAEVLFDMDFDNRFLTLARISGSDIWLIG